MKKIKLTISCLVILSLITIGFLPSVQSIENKNTILSTDETIIEMIQQINKPLVSRYLNSLIDFGPRYTGSQNCENAGDFIYEEFQKMDLDVEFHEWSFQGFKSRNIVATLEGNDLSSNAIFIMSAHYDCTPGSLGADDDASGVAAMMAAANIMSKYSFNHTIRFIAFSGEEVGTYGSYLYARDAYKNEDNIVAVLNADMVGYADSTEGGKTIRFFHENRASWIAEYAITISEKYYDIVDMMVEDMPNYKGSDHQAFTYYGYDAVWIAHHDGYKWSNSPDDTPDHLNFTYLTKASKILLAVLSELAIRPINVQVVFKTPLEGYRHIFNRKKELPITIGRKWYWGMRGITVIFGTTMAKVEVISNEEIDHVIFCIDDNFIAWDSEPPYEWYIEGKVIPPMGRHKLQVYAYTKSGDVAFDEMDILIFSYQYQYRKF